MTPADLQGVIERQIFMLGTSGFRTLTRTVPRKIEAGIIDTTISLGDHRHGGPGDAINAVMKLYRAAMVFR